MRPLSTGGKADRGRARGCSRAGHGPASVRAQSERPCVLPRFRPGPAVFPCGASERGRPDAGPPLPGGGPELLQRTLFSALGPFPSRWPVQLCVLAVCTAHVSVPPLGVSFTLDAPPRHASPKIPGPAVSFLRVPLGSEPTESLGTPVSEGVPLCFSTKL